MIKQIALLLLLSLVGVFPAAAQSRPAVPVFVTEVNTAPFSDPVEALGTLQANESIILTSTVADIVTRINFEDGAYVEKGDILVELADAEEKAQLQEQQSTLNEAKRQIDRLRPLIRQGAASKALLDEREREYETALARVNAIKSRLADYVITAPFSGVVGLRNISTGALVQPGTPITSLDDLSVMKLDFTVPSVHLSALRRGLPITARNQAYPDHVFEGEIASIGSKIDPVTRSIRIRALLPNDDGILKPGLLMNVILSKNQRQAMIIPEGALLAENKNIFAFVVKTEGDERYVEKRPVTIGARRPGEVEIREGLSPGELIVTDGTLKLQDGAKVEIKAHQQGGESLQQLLNSTRDTSAAELTDQDQAP